jgi:hypothetical protein
MLGRADKRPRSEASKRLRRTDAMITKPGRSGRWFAESGSKCFIGLTRSAIDRRRSDAHDESWATPQQVAAKGLLLRDRTLISAAEGAAF